LIKYPERWTGHSRNVAITLSNDARQHIGLTGLSQREQFHNPSVEGR